jgi:hypothetical protein
MSIYTDLVPAVNEAAEALTKANKPQFTSEDVSQWLEKHRAGDWERFAPSFKINFSVLTRDEASRIERVPGRYLYQLAPEEPDDALVAEDSIPEATSTTIVSEDRAPTASEPRKTQREYKLYAVLRDWLQSRGYQAAVTARGKKGGTWGNPDITGLRVDELPLGTVSFECATIEAKLSSDNWRYWLFEAVAHKRFAHRAYFAFAFGTDSPGLDKVKEVDKMCEYAEKYRIGILVVFIPKSQYETLTSGDAASLSLDTVDARIETPWPAFYESVQTPALNEFVTDVLEISRLSELQRFGSG